jgi:hypothetical protein
MAPSGLPGPPWYGSVPPLRLTECDDGGLALEEPFPGGLTPAWILSRGRGTASRRLGTKAHSRPLNGGNSKLVLARIQQHEKP